MSHSFNNNNNNQYVGSQQPNTIPPIAPPLPPDWMAITDPNSGRIYFANMKTGQTSWDPPPFIGFPPPPPPPLPPPVSQPPLTTMNLPFSNSTTSSSSSSSSMIMMSTHNHVVNNTMTPAVTSATNHIVNNNSVMIPFQHCTTTTHGNNSIAITPNNILPSQPIMEPIPSTLLSTYIVPKARAILNNNDASSISNPNTTPNNSIEYSELSAGMLADLVHIQQEQRLEESTITNHNNDEVEDDDDDLLDNEANIQKKYRYEPVKPFELHLLAKAPHIEPGRVEIRYQSLMDALRRI